MFPIDDVTLEYLRLTGRSEQQVALVEAYAKTQGMWLDPSVEPRFSEYLELDLSTVVPSIAGPKRPQDRIEVSRAKEQFRGDLKNYVVDGNGIEKSSVDQELVGTFPASDSPSHDALESSESAGRPSHSQPRSNGDRATNPAKAVIDGTEVEIDHGHVVIASITSCTNTSNPSVMMAAAMLAKNAVERGLQVKPWVKTSMAPGSKVVTSYYEKAGMCPTSRSWATTSSATAARPASATRARSSRRSPRRSTPTTSR